MQSAKHSGWAVHFLYQTGELQEQKEGEKSKSRQNGDVWSMSVQKD